MILDSNVKLAVTCQKCGKINIEELNLFRLSKDKEIKSVCSCGSLSCIIYSDKYKDIKIVTDCMYCGKKHDNIYKVKDFIQGIKVICPEIGMPIVKTGDIKAISAYIKNINKHTIEALYDEDFESFFNNHSIMKKSLERLIDLKEADKVSCECGKSDITLEIYPDRIELICVECHSIKIIYAESLEDLQVFHEKKRIRMKPYEFEFIDAANNSDHK